MKQNLKFKLSIVVNIILIIILLFIVSHDYKAEPETLYYKKILGYQRPALINIEIIEKEETTTRETVEDAITIAQREIDAALSQREHTEAWYKEYKSLREKYNDVIPYITIYDTTPEEEIYIMQRCIETETYQKEFDAKVNVCSVVLNRAVKQQTTAYEVITKPQQFAYDRKIISESTKLAVEYACEFGDTTGGCLWFHSYDNIMEWYLSIYRFSGTSFL